MKLEIRILYLTWHFLLEELTMPWEQAFPGTQFLLISWKRTSEIIFVHILS
jgi:hypothetical protein